MVFVAEVRLSSQKRNQALYGANTIPRSNSLDFLRAFKDRNGGREDRR
jgi:hypothetical protein